MSEQPAAQSRFFKDPLSPWAAILTCSAVAIIPASFAVSGATFGVIGRLMRDDLELDSIEFSVISSIYFVPLALLPVFAGRLVDRHGLRGIATVVVLLGGLATLSFALSASLLAAAGSRLAIGVAAAFGMPMFGVVTARMLTARGVTLAMGVITALFGVAGYVGSIAGDSALRKGDWREPMWIVPVVTLPIAAFVWWCLRSPSLQQSRSASAPQQTGFVSAIVQLFAIREVRSSVMVAFAVGGVFWSFGGAWNALVARVVWRLPPEEWGAVCGAFHIGMGVAAPLLALWAARVGTRVPIRITTGLAFLTLCVWLFSPIQLNALVSQAVVGLLGASASVLAINVASALRCVPVASAGICAGLLSCAATLGGLLLLVLPPLTTLVPESTPLYRTYFCGAAIAALLGLAHLSSYGSSSGGVSKSPEPKSCAG